MSYEQSSSLSPLPPPEPKPEDRPTKRRRNIKASTSLQESVSASGSQPPPGKVVHRPRACAECRRMKLKCDRVFPCKTCVKRGLEGICPDGKLVTGRGTRYILADTEKLHEKILRMADRIRSLEEALDSIHREHWACGKGIPTASTSATRSLTSKGKGSKDKQFNSADIEPHPLLHPELLQIKGQLELYGLTQGSPSNDTSVKRGLRASPPSESSMIPCTDPSVDRKEGRSLVKNYNVKESDDLNEYRCQSPIEKMSIDEDEPMSCVKQSRTKLGHLDEAHIRTKSGGEYSRKDDIKPPMLAKSSSIMSGFFASNSQSDLSDEETPGDVKKGRGRSRTKRKYSGTDGSDMDVSENHDVESYSKRKETLEGRGERLLALLPPIEETERLFILACEFSSWIINIALVPSVPRLIADLYDISPEKVNPAAVALALTALSISVRLDGLRSDSDSSSGTFSDTSTSDNTRMGSQSPYSSRRKRARSTICQDSKEVGHSTTGMGKKERKEARDTERELKAGVRREKSRKSAQWYHSKALQVLGEVRLQSDPEIDVVKTLYLMSWYLCALTDFKDAGRQANIATSLAVKIALKIGLHRDETHKAFRHDEAQERRVLFWSLLHLEERLVFGTARATTMSSVEITCKRPELSDLLMIKNFPTSAEAIFYNWKLRFLDQCIIPINRAMKKMHLVRVVPIDYYHVLSLDKAVRDLSVPEVLSPPTVPLRNRSREPVFGDDAPYIVLMMLRARVEQEKLIALLHLHRECFSVHVREQHQPRVQRLFFPSAIATFSAACALVKSVRDLYAVEPEMVARISLFWYNAFCGATSLFWIASWKPFCPVAMFALKELEKARDLFYAASPKCYMAARSYPILVSFASKATEVFKNWKARTGGDIWDVLGPNGEITLCQTRVDLVVKVLQEPSVLNRDDDREYGKSVFEDGYDASAAATSQADEADNEMFLYVWKYVHKDVTNIVRRLPKALTDARKDLKSASLSRLLWDFESLPEEPIYYFGGRSNVPSCINRDFCGQDLDGGDADVEMSPVFPPELDWDVLSKVLMAQTTPLTSPLSVKPHHCQLGPSPDFNAISNIHSVMNLSRPMSSSSTLSESAPPLTPKAALSPFYLLDALSNINVNRDGQESGQGDDIYDSYSDRSFPARETVEFSTHALLRGLNDEPTCIYARGTSVNANN